MGDKVKPKITLKMSIKLLLGVHEVYAVRVALTLIYFNRRVFWRGIYL